jgi:hypothetical protein
MRQSTVNHNGGTRTLARQRWLLETQVREARAEFRAIQNALAMERVHQASVF